MQYDVGAVVLRDSMSAPNLDGCFVNAYYKSRRRVEMERTRFREVYFKLCAASGIAALDYVERHGCVFNIFELYCCVLRQGGYAKLCAERRWHHVGYELCRISKRSPTAARAAQECYAEALEPVAAGLASLKLKPFATTQFVEDEESDLRTEVAVLMGKEPIEGPGKRAKLRTRSQPMRQLFVRRFKKRTSFDLLSTIPLPPAASGQYAVVSVVAPPLRRRAAPSTDSAPLELQDAYPGDVWRSAVEWLRVFAQTPLKSENALEARYRVRYSSRLLRMRQKLNQNYQRQNTKGILNHAASEGSEARTQDSDESDDEGDVKRTVVVEGPQYQAEIPEWRPATSESASSKWDTPPLRIDGAAIERPLLLTGDKRELRLLSQESRLQWMNECSGYLWRNLAGFAQELALNRMGQIVQTGWSPSEEERFAAGIAKYGRDFASIQLEYLPERSLDQLIMYYYSIWKQRRTRGASLHYHQKQQRLQEAEKQAASQEMEAENQRRRLSEESKKRRLGRSQQRKLKDVLNWIRSLAKNPDQGQLMQTRPFYSCALRMAHLYRSGSIQPK